MFPFYLFTRMQGSNIFKHSISEFVSPWQINPKENAPFFPIFPLYIYYSLCVLSFFFLVGTFLKRKTHEIFLLLAFFILSYMAIRNIPLFIIVSIPIFGLCLKDIGKIFKKKFRRLNKLDYIILSTLSIFVLFLIPRVITDAYYISNRRFIKFGIGIHEFVHPIKAVEFLNKNNLTGKIINDLNSGSWLIWKGPGKVFIDGRLEVMKERFFSEYRMSFDYEKGLELLINKYKPDLILYDHSVSLKWFFQLRKIPNWRMIYFDENNAVFARDGYAINFLEIDMMKKISEMGIDTAMKDTEIWDILSVKYINDFKRWLFGLYKKQKYPYELMKMGIFAYQSGNFRAAELLHIEFIKETEGKLYEGYFNLGSIYYRYYRMKEYDKSKYCYERVLKFQPKNRIANERVKEYERMKYIKNK